MSNELKTKASSLKEIARRPSITELAEQLGKYQCDHLVGRAVIEQSIAELAAGKMAGDYCKNWDQCGCGYSRCTPTSSTKLETIIRQPEFQHVFSQQEREVIAKVKQRLESISANVVQQKL